MDSAELLSGVGRRLAEAREARQWTREMVADKLKLSLSQVEGIETENSERLPQPVFLRGFLRNYALLLGLDPDQILQPDPDAVSPSSCVTAPSAGVRFNAGGIRRWMLVLPVVGGLFVVLVVSLYLWLSNGHSVEVENTLRPPPVAQEVPPDSVQMPQPVSAPAPAATPVTPPESAVPVQAVPPAAVAPAAPTGVSTITPTPPPAPGAQGKLKFILTQNAWIEVRDGTGSRLIARDVSSGEPVEVKGVGPFKLVLGNAAHVSLLYNDHPIDLRPFIGEKVARLTLE
jgi:cytoskeleton protein RodZ